MVNRAVFLDRDGVLNRSDERGGRPFAPTLAENFDILPESVEALRLLKKAGFLLVVVTNQPDIAYGKMPREALDEMNRRLVAALPEIDRVEVSFGRREDNDPRRKPLPGMLLDAAKALDIDLPRSYIIGDRWSDIAAGEAAGCHTIFIQRGYTEQQPEHPHFTCTNVLEAARIILRENDLDQLHSAP